MKKLCFYCVLAIMCASVGFAEGMSTYVPSNGTWIWPLGSDESEQADGEVVLRPGNVENHVYGNVFANENYLITANEGSPIYAPVDGTVDHVAIVIDSHSLHGVMFMYDFEDIDLAEWEKLLRDDCIEDLKKFTSPSFTPENVASKIISIKLNDGKTLWIAGFLDIDVEAGQKITKGQQLGTLGYNPMHYNEPSLQLSLSTKEGRRSSELGEFLLGEDNSHFFGEYLARF